MVKSNYRDGSAYLQIKSINRTISHFIHRKIDRNTLYVFYFSLKTFLRFRNTVFFSVSYFTEHFQRQFSMHNLHHQHESKVVT